VWPPSRRSGRLINQGDCIFPVGLFKIPYRDEQHRIAGIICISDISGELK
jgi:hypothetical protein